jgi:hypothetical protein
MSSMDIILERLNNLSGILIPLFIMGLIFLIIGIKTWITKSSIVLGRNYSMQGWRRPKFVTGRKALFWAKLDIIIGSFFLATCLLIALSVL